ncbi:MFS transporter [Georgenia sp. Z1491]|uniref:MFS transporter n=1 Tax=Georgenia sp. Z1491 TaxID=3416707 RepID=UPI003CEF12D7
MTTRDTTAPPAHDVDATVAGGTAERGVDGPVPAIAATVREPLGRRFAVHLTGVGIANLADGLILVGVPLVAITLTRSPGQISLIQVAFWLPWLLLGMVAGVVVDRSDRRHVQLVGGAARLAVVAGLAALAVTDNLSIPLLVAGVGLYGVTQVFVDLAGSSIVPQLVPRSRLTAANGRVMGLEQIGTNFLGAPVAGFLVAAGAGWVFGIPVALGLAFLLVLGLGMRGDFRPRRSAPTEPVGGRLQQVLEGLRLQVRHPVLRPLLIAQSVLNFASTAYFAVFVLWMVGAESAVGMTPERYAMLAALLAVGAIVGSFLAEHVSRWLPEVPVLIGSWAIQFGALLVPVLVPEPWAIGIALVVVGLLNMIGNVVTRTLRQRLIPADALGRVGGAGGMIGYGLMPLGALAGGLVGELWGLPAVFVGTVVLALVVVAYVATRISSRLVAAHEIEHDDVVA